MADGAATPAPKAGAAGGAAAGDAISRTGTPLLEARGISVHFGGVQALKDVSVEVRAGEAVGLVGPNGAGKTTLFDCISGRRRPDGGTVLVDGEPVDALPAHRRARLGLARTFQRLEVFPELTVREHLLVAERARRGDGALWKDLLNMGRLRPEELHRAEALLELVGLAEVADTPVAALGLGLCRLVELGRALALEPRLLLADEPSSGLDLHETDALAGVLSTVQRERDMAVLLVEHDLSVVARTVSRVLVLDAGRSIASGSFEDVIADPEVRRAYLGRNS